MSYLPAIEKILDTFPEVSWERYIGNLAGITRIYGWIIRPERERDFFVIDIEEGKPYDFATSAYDLAESFAKRLNHKISTFEGVPIGNSLPNISLHNPENEVLYENIRVKDLNKGTQLGYLKIKKSFTNILGPHTKFLLEGKFTNNAIFKASELLILN